MSGYTYRYFIFVEWNKLTPANDQAAEWDVDTGGEYTFGGVRLSADGQEPPTHSCCDTFATEAMSIGILNALGSIPFFELYQLNDGITQRRDHNEWTTIPSIGSFKDTVLDDVGLQIIVKEFE